MKKLFVFIIALALAFSTFSLVACDLGNGDKEEKEIENVTITFVQEGQQNKSYTIEKGDDLINVPDPVPVVGYDVVWSVEDFSNIKKDITVNAVLTAKTFTISFACTLAPVYSVNLPVKEISVKYGGDLSGKLPTDATCSKYGERYTFNRWVDKDGNTFNKEIYDIADDITLYAVFNIEFA